MISISDLYAVLSEAALYVYKKRTTLAQGSRVLSAIAGLPGTLCQQMRSVPRQLHPSSMSGEWRVSGHCIEYTAVPTMVPVLC